MAQFGITDCASSGFGLFARRPASMIGLILFWAIVGVAPAIVAAAIMLPGIIDAVQALKAQTGEDMNSAALHNIGVFFGSIAGLLVPLILWTSIIQAVFNAAVYRAVIEPEKGGFAYLRLGGDEVRQFFASLLLGLLLLVFYAILGCGVAGMIFVAKEVGDPWQGWIIALGAIVAVLVFIWLVVRFSLALAATFGEKRIAIFDSWRLTKGQFWRIIGMCLMLFLFLIGISIVGGVLRMIVMLAFGGGHFAAGMQDLKNLGALREALHQGAAGLLKVLGPGLIASFVVQALVQTFSRIITLAPFAKAYAQLSGVNAVHKEF